MEEMRFKRIEINEIVNGNGVGITLWVQGCPHHCQGCFNPETWDFNGGEEFNYKAWNIILEALNHDYISRFSISGGEPLYPDNIMELLIICKEIRIKYPLIDIWLWTGYTWEQLQERMKKAQEQWPTVENDYYLRGLLSLVDYAIVGPFIEEEKDLTLQWRGSRNQEIIDVEKSLAKGEKIIWEE